MSHQELFIQNQREKSFILMRIGYKNGDLYRYKSHIQK